MLTELLLITHCLVGVGITPSHLLIIAMLVWCIYRLIILYSSDGLGSGVTGVLVHIIPTHRHRSIHC